MNKTSEVKTVVPYPRERLLMVDGGRLGRKKHMIHGVVEFDITDSREKIRQYRIQRGEELSFSVFFLSCLANAIDRDKQMHAYRNWRNQLVIFNDVDVNMLFEVEEDGRKVIWPHIIRAANHKSLGQLQQEIRGFKEGFQTSQESVFIKWFVKMPAIIRRGFLNFLFLNPQLVKDYYGTVMLSSVAMFASGSGWGIPVPNHTLQVTLGGMSRKPGVVKDAIAVREYLSVTLSFDHDVVDGAPAARFLQHLKQLVEGGVGL